MEVLGLGYRIPFLRVPLLSLEPIPIASYPPLSTKGIALEEVTLSLVERGAVELAPLPSPKFFSRMFIVWKTSGIAWTIPSLSPGRTPVSRIYFGGWTQTVFVAGYVCLGSHPTTTSGQARPTWAGVLNSVSRSFWASGFRKRRLYPSMQGSCWLWSRVSSTFTPPSAIQRSLCLWTTPLPWLIFATQGAHALWPSIPLSSVFSGGQNSAMYVWLPSSSWDVTMFWPTLSLVRTRSRGPNGLYTWRSSWSSVTGGRSW